MPDKYAALRQAVEKATPGPWEITNEPGSANGIAHKGGGHIAFVAPPRTVSDERLDGESWLAMRDRTEPDRLAVVAERYANQQYIAAANPAVITALLTERDGLIAQHHRDSAELRSLCAARDEARKQRDALRDALKQCAAVCAGETSNKQGLVAALEAARAALGK